MGDHEKQFSYDEVPLAEGQYRAWFYKGLQQDQLAFLRTPTKAPESSAQEPTYKNQEFPQARDWRDEAACKDADPMVFFDESHYPRREFEKPDAEWRQYCPQCPVREACLELARKSESVGIFGGKIFMPGKGRSRHPIEFEDGSMGKRGRPRKAI